MAKKHIVIPKDLTERGISNSVKSSQIDLTEDVRRHVVVGIALNNYLVPKLKQYVDQQMKLYYSKLVRDYRIDTPQSRLDEKVINRGRLGLRTFLLLLVF